MLPWVTGSSSQVLQELEAAGAVGDAAPCASDPDKFSPRAWLQAWI